MIQNFYNTIQKLQIDEETDIRDLVEIKEAIYEISKIHTYYKSILKVFEICETLTEGLRFLQNELNDILSAITFASLNIQYNNS